MIKYHGKILEQVLNVGGKLTYHHVKGGVLLIPTEFTIKEDLIKNNIDKFPIQ